MILKPLGMYDNALRALYELKLTVGESAFNEALKTILANYFARQDAHALDGLASTCVVDGVRWNRAVNYADSTESRCGCNEVRDVSKVRDGRTWVHVVECCACDASWCWGRA